MSKGKKEAGTKPHGPESVIQKEVVIRFRK